MSAVLNAIQSGTFTLTNGSTTDTVDRGVDTGFDSAVTPGKTMLVFTIRSSDGTANNPATMCVTGVLTDGDTITFTRGTGTGDVIIEWRLIEWTSGVIVQHLTKTIANPNTTETLTITGATAGGRFILASGIVTTNGDEDRNNVRMSFNSDTEVGFERDSGFGADIVVALQVVEYEGCTVQEKTFTFTTTTNATETGDLDSAVTIANTLLLATATWANGVADSSFTMSFADTDTINFDRASTTSDTIKVTVFAIEFTDGTTVQHNGSDLGDGTDTGNVTVSAVTLAQSVAVMSGARNLGLSCGAINVGTPWDRIASTSVLTSTTNHQHVRGDSTKAIQYDSQVIQFALGGGSTPRLVTTYYHDIQ